MEREMFGLPKLELPPERPLTPEELERQHKIVQEIHRLREKIGPVDMTLEELFGNDDGDDCAPLWVARAALNARGL